MRCRFLAVLLVFVVWIAASSPLVRAQTFGLELHNTLMPASGGMAGTSLSRPQDLQSAINANPARYADLLLEEVPPHLREEVLPPRYAETERFSPQDFEQLHTWMVDHTMIAPDVRYEAITRPPLTI